MPKLLDYARPTPVPQGISPAMIPALLIAGLEQVLIFLLYTAALDGARLFRYFAMMSAGYWLSVGVLLVYRRRNPSLLDLAIVVFGYPVLVCVCIAALKAKVW